MPPGEAFAVVGVVLLAISLIATWVHNGRSQSKRDGALEQRIKGIENKLDDDNNGLSAIKKSVDDQRVHCAGMTSSFQERIKDLEGK